MNIRKFFNGCHNDSRFSMLKYFCLLDIKKEYATEDYRTSDLWSI